MWLSRSVAMMSESEFRVPAPKLPKYFFDSVCLPYQNDLSKTEQNRALFGAVFYITSGLEF
jgi:hypothetical protein